MPTCAGMVFGEYSTCNGLVMVDAKFGTPLAPGSICFCAPASRVLDGVSDGMVGASVVRYFFFCFSPQPDLFFILFSSSFD